MKFVPAKLSRFVAKAALKVSKKSPEILLATGIISGVASTVVACRATLKADKVLDEHKEMIDGINKALEECPEDYTEKDKKRDTAIAYGKTIGKFVKLYSPAIALGTLSIVSFCASYGILKKRNVALTLAYGELLKNYNHYRDKVKEKYGDEVDKEIIFGEAEPVVEKGADEKTEKVTFEGNTYSQYAKFFDATSPNWVNDAYYNKSFLTQLQEEFNWKLRSRGHVFLNEVYEALGFDHTPEGALVGWIYDPENDNDGGDGHIDFGIWDCKSAATRRFVNGYENVILLDFNVDGVIYDKI